MRCFYITSTSLIPKNEDKVFILMRSVHHQFARHLMELFPYDRSKFLSISRNKYIESTKSIAWIFKGETQGRRGFILAGYPNKKGFFTFHSLLSPEKDFAEIISLKLTYGPKVCFRLWTEPRLLTMPDRIKIFKKNMMNKRFRHIKNW